MEIFSTAYLPGIIYIQQYIQASDPVIDLGENYIKQTHRNRGVICSSNGPLPLIVPLRKSDKRRTVDMSISYSEDWQSQHLKAIRSCYKNSPYFEHYQPEFENIILDKYDLLHQLNGALLSWILLQVDIKIKHRLSEVYIEAKGEDYRNFDYFKLATRPYKQVFSDRNGFLPGCGVIDLLFNKGPEAMVTILDLRLTINTIKKF